MQYIYRYLSLYIGLTLASAPKTPHKMSIHSETELNYCSRGVLLSKQKAPEAKRRRHKCFRAKMAGNSLLVPRNEF